MELREPSTSPEVVWVRTLLQDTNLRVVGGGNGKQAHYMYLGLSLIQ
jgi:hypothetical protein